jgi:hypothetical protein
MVNEMDHTLPEKRRTDCLWWILLPLIVIAVIIVTGFLSISRTDLLLEYSSIKDMEIYGYSAIHLMIGRTVVHPHVPRRYKPVLTPSVIRGMSSPFAIHGTIKDDRIEFSMRSTSGNAAIDQAIINLTDRWNNAPVPYVCPIQHFEFNVNFHSERSVRVDVETIEVPRPNTKSVFYGPTRYGRYVRKIIPMSGFNNILVEFLGDSGDEYNKLNRAFKDWGGRGL